MDVCYLGETGQLHVTQRRTANATPPDQQTRSIDWSSDTGSDSCIRSDLHKSTLYTLALVAPTVIGVFPVPL